MDKTARVAKGVCSMKTLVFDGLNINCWQENEYSYKVQFKKIDLLSGDKFGNLGPKTTCFPKTFNCYASTQTELDDTIGKLSRFGTFVLDGISYLNCIISDFGNIKRVLENNEMYTFVLTFDQVDYK